MAGSTAGWLALTQDVAQEEDAGRVVADAQAVHRAALRHLLLRPQLVLQSTPLWIRLTTFDASEG